MSSTRSTDSRWWSAGSPRGGDDRRAPVRALRRLSNLGIRIRIITHRLVIEHFHQIAVSQTVEWLDRHGIPYWDLCFMGERAVNADLYIEDSPHNVEALRRDQHDVIVFSHAANRHLEVPAGSRARTWTEAEPLIVERFRAWESRVTADATGAAAEAIAG